MGTLNFVGNNKWKYSFHNNYSEQFSIIAESGKYYYKIVLKFRRSARAQQRISDRWQAYYTRSLDINDLKEDNVSLKAINVFPLFERYDYNDAQSVALTHIKLIIKSQNRDV